MKAIRVHQFGGPEELQYESNIPLPKLEPGRALLRVRAVGINPVETYIRAGTYALKPTLPFIPGKDFAGEVVEVASNVTTLKKGDRVFSGNAISGSYAEYAVISADSAQSLPSELSFEQGAAIPIPYYTAYRALCIRARAKPGETVLVHGASGGVGVAAVQLARSYGMTVFGTAGSLRGVGVVKKAGADFVFNHNEKGYMDAMRAEIEKRGGVDVVVENAGHANLGADLTLLANGGRVAVVGGRGPVEMMPRDAMVREASILGVMLFGSTEEEMRETKAAVQAGIAAGWLRPIVGKVYSLENASQGHREITSGCALGKMVLNVPE